MQKFIYLFIVLGLAWVIYSALYTSPEQKKMTQLISTKPTQNNFESSFEGAPEFLDLFPSDFSGWHGRNWQENETKIFGSIKYCLINKSHCQISSQKINQAEIETQRFQKGRASLKLEAAPAKNPGKWKASRNSLRRHGFKFTKGDDVYFSGWFYLEDQGEKSAAGLTLWALKSEAQSFRYKGEPGRNLRLTSKEQLASRLANWIPEPAVFGQASSRESTFPKNKWVHLKIHLKLSDDKDGLMEVWQNDQKVISEKGVTLPEANSIYSILEVGILENTSENHPQKLYIDDIKISDQPLES